MDCEQRLEAANEVLAAVERVLEELQANEPSLTSRLIDGPRQYAAAAMSRGCSLVRAGLSALRGGEPEATGVIARVAWESGLVGMYLAGGGQKAFIRMEAEQLRQNSYLAGVHQLPPEVLDQRRRELREVERQRQVVEEGRDTDDPTPISFDRLKLEDIARMAGPMVEELTGGPVDLLAAYDLFYRPHSAWDTHGMHAIDSHIKAVEKEDRLELRTAVPWLEPEKPLAVVTIYLAMLGGIVFEKFGVAADELSARAESLLQLMGEGVGLGSDLSGWEKLVPDLIDAIE